ncbi:MAG: hypothetical protein EBS01_03810 [Verrucomicrobia bacterium]|nr:hypothetical protein [Verrucomicrobiota bacterium]
MFSLLGEQLGTVCGDHVENGSVLRFGIGKLRRPSGDSRKKLGGKNCVRTGFRIFQTNARKQRWEFKRKKPFLHASAEFRALKEC